jgi:hypothetical protein
MNKIWQAFNAGRLRRKWFLSSVEFELGGVDPYWAYNLGWKYQSWRMN